MTGDAVGIALVGCGGMGLRHLAAFAAMEVGGVPSVRLGALCDADEGRRAKAAQWFADRTGRVVPTVADFVEVSAVADVCAVDLAVPTFLHHPLALRAFTAGLHVLVEKPIALTIRMATDMAEAATAAGKILAVAENFRRIPANRAFKGLIDDGAIGRPYFTTSTLALPAAMLHPEGQVDWYRDRFTSGSLVALEMGVHEMDLLQYWFGRPELVSALVCTFERTLSARDGREIQVTSEDSCFATVTLPGEIVAHVTLTMAGHGRTLGERHVVGSEGSISSDAWEAWQHGAIVRDAETSVPFDTAARRWIDRLTLERRDLLLPAGTWDPADLTVDTAEPLRYGVAYEIYDFARAIASDGRPEIGATEAISALAAAIALLESSGLGREVAVADVLSGELDTWQSPIDDHLRAVSR